MGASASFHVHIYIYILYTYVYVYIHIVQDIHLEHHLENAWWKLRQRNVF